MIPFNYSMCTVKVRLRLDGILDDVPSSCERVSATAVTHVRYHALRQVLVVAGVANMHSAAPPPQ
jgi:hypothetical protein